MRLHYGNMDLKSLTEVKPAKVLGSIMDALEGKAAGPALHALNLMLPQVIPFNRPLGLKIRKLTAEVAEVEIPFKRANKNHLGGIHACAMATVGEYCAGLLIIKRLGFEKYRLVLKSLSVEYLKQGRTTSSAQAEWPSDAPLIDRSIEEAVDIQMLTVLRSKEGDILARIKTLWQVKPWSLVKMR